MRFLGIQNCETESFGLYETHLGDGGVAFDRFPAYRGHGFPPLGGYDAILVGGTPLAAYEFESHPFLVAEERYLRAALSAGRPCLGICFGAQLMAQILGAAVYPAAQKEIGVYRLEVTPAGRSDPLLAGFPERFPAFQWHGDTFDVPPGAELLVTGAPVRHQMFRLGRAVGVQFHLETPLAETGCWVDAYRDELARFGKTRAALLAETGRHEVETLALAERLIANFVTGVRRSTKTPAGKRRGRLRD